jgi:ComF family protein
MRISILDLIFPRICVGCGFIGTYVCNVCEKKMKRVVKRTCFYCERSSLYGFTHPACKHKGGIDGLISIYVYDDLFKKILLESKYKGAHLILSELLKFSQPSIAYELSVWKNVYNPTITDIPLHPQRMRERGFNQSDIISRASYVSIFSKSQLLKRVINTPHLANIANKKQRKEYIKNAFTYIGKTPPNSVLIIDDVVTSGATILECSKELKRQGVQTVLAFSLAKG